MNKARASRASKRLVFGEGEETKIIRAAAQVVDEGIAQPILIGRPEIIHEKIKLLNLNFSPQVVDPSRLEKHEKYAQAYYELRQRKGMTLAQARKRVTEPNVLGPMMVKMGDADAFISGLTYEYPEVIRPALQIQPYTAPGVTCAAGVYIMVVGDKTYLFTDATVNIEPSPEDLAQIACLAADFARQLEIEPRVAFLSFSNFGSTPHPLSQKVRSAGTDPRLPSRPGGGWGNAGRYRCGGRHHRAAFPLQRGERCQRAGLPSLESANIAYKLLARLGNAKPIGPILLGMGAPIHVLQTGDEVNDIVQVAAVAVMDAMSRAK